MGRGGGGVLQSSPAGPGTWSLTNVSDVRRGCELPLNPEHLERALRGRSQELSFYSLSKSSKPFSEGVCVSTDATAVVCL